MYLFCTPGAVTAQAMMPINIDWCAAFAHLALIWGNMYWRELFMQAGAVTGVVLEDRKTDALDLEAIEAFDDATEKAQQTTARLIALQEALKAVCHHHGLEYLDVVTLAGVPFESWPLDADPDYLEEVKASLLECMPA